MAATYTITLNGRKEQVTFDRVIVRGDSGKVEVSIGQLMDFLENGVFGQNSMICFENYSKNKRYETCIPSENIENISQYGK